MLEQLPSVETLPPERWVKIRYEDVCRDPVGALKPVLRLIGQEDVRLPDELRATEHHVLVNYMRLRAGEQVSLNEKWRTELSAHDLAISERVAGDLNRRTGTPERIRLNGYVREEESQ